MKRYNIISASRRLAQFISTLILLLVVVFFLIPLKPESIARERCAKCYPDDIEVLTVASNDKCFVQSLKLDKPLFYVELANLATPDTFSQIYPSYKKKAMGYLLYRSGNWPSIHAYYILLDKLQQTFPHELIRGLYRNPWLAQQYFNEIEPMLDTLPASTYLQFKKTISSYRKINNETNKWKVYVPSMIIHGLDNQFHHWISGLITNGNVGISQREIDCRTCNCLSSSNTSRQLLKIQKPFIMSLAIALIATLCIMIISTPLGIILAMYYSSWISRLGSTFLLIWESIPSFIVAMVCYIQFQVRDYQQHESFWYEMQIAENRYLLVIALMVYISFFIAPVSQLIATNLSEEMHKDYFRTALVKGNSLFRALRKHALPNIRILLITYSIYLAIGLLSASVVVEYMFDIPGVGIWIFEAAQSRDIQPLMVALALIGSCTLIGTSVLNILYKKIDPRIP